MRLFLVTMFCLLAVGCNSDLRCRRETALLQAEILDWEDKYFALKSKYENGSDSRSAFASEPYYEGGAVYEGQMTDDSGVIYDGAVYESDVMPNRAQTTDQSATAPGQFNEAAGAPNSGLGRSSDDDPRAEPDSSDPQLPAFGTEKVPDRIPQPNPSTDASGANQLDPQLHSSTIILSNYGIDADPREPDVTEILINSNMTRGRNLDGEFGDEGLEVWVQPRTADGSVEYEIGELTVSVIDPSESPERQWIGLWKFLPEETELFFADDSQVGRGILLHLPWEQTTPVNDQLVLHVRLVTLDGRVLTTSSDIRINPPSPEYSPNDSMVAKWTQSDTRWLPDPDRTNLSGVSESRNTGNPVPALQASTVPGADSSPFRAANSGASARAKLERPAWRPIR